MDLLPEVRQLVAEYLEPEDCLACMQVSRTWHDSISEKAYRYVMIQSGYSIHDREPPVGWMQKYGRFVEQLCLVSSAPLQRLLITVDPQEQYQKDRKQVIVLFPNSKEFIMDTHCTLREVEKWLLHFPRLEFLSLNNVESLPTTDADTGETIATKDRSARLLQHCPKLTKLDISNMSQDGFLLQADDLVEIINHCSPLLTEFILLDDGISCLWFEPLSGFLERLTVLDLYSCRRVEDWMFKRIACSCPLLVEFRWPFFDVNGLFSEVDAGTTTALSTTTTTTTTTSEDEGARMGPWACTGLRFLAIDEVTWSHSGNRNRAAMEHLGLLRDLRHLGVRVMRCDIVNKEDRDRFFETSPWPEDSCIFSVTDDPDAQWMRKIWPLLDNFEFLGWV